MKMRQLLAERESIYAENSFSLRHNVIPSMTNQRKWSPLPDLNCSPVVGEIKQLLHELAKNAKLELMRGNDQAVKELLEVFLESGDEFSKVEKKNVANGERKSPEPPNCKGLPFVKGVTL